MGLNAPIPGLRPLRYDSKSVAKVQINVAPDTVLIVSDDLAAQLQAADSHFKDFGAVTTIEAAPAPEPAPEPEPPAPAVDDDEVGTEPAAAEEPATEDAPAARRSSKKRT